MLPNSTAVSQIQQYVRAQQGVIQVERSTPDQLLFTVGERVQATVTGMLPNGRYSVLVKDQLLDLNLPRNTEPGEQLDLTVVAKEPRLTFSLPNSQNQATAGVTPGVVLSKAAQVLSEFAASPDGKTRAATLQQSQPLFDGDPQPEKLAGQLAGRLAESGLFYESHQAEWVKGERPLQTLLREPQAKFSPTGNESIREGGVREQSGNLTQARETVLPARAATDAAELEQLPAMNRDAGTRGTPQTPEQGPKQIVQQQLALLENHPLVWIGQAWPGQAMYWTTELQNEGHAAQAEADASRVWQTRLDLNLPRLGQLGVSAMLRDGQFSLRFEAENPETVALLQQYQTELSGRFDAAGLKLVSTQVSRQIDEFDEQEP